jgi:predicted Zn-dependent protease
MTKMDQQKLFRRALQAYRLGRLEEAGDGFQRLVEAGTIEPLHLSFHGLLLAIRQQRAEEGLELCSRALLLAPDRPEAYLNLARVYRKMGRPGQSVHTLRQGLRARPKDPALRREISYLCPRRKPAIGALHRDHPFNKVLGKLRARLTGSRQRTA